MSALEGDRRSSVPQDASQLDVEQLRRDFDAVFVTTVDVPGRMLARTVSVEQLAAGDPSISTCVLAWDVEQGLDRIEVEVGGRHTGWHDVRLRPDLATLRRYPLAERTAICFGDLVDHDGRLVAVAPRTILRDALARVRAAGYEPATASELEFYLFAGRPEELRRERFRDLRTTALVRSDYSLATQLSHEPFLAAMRGVLAGAGIDLHSWQSEHGIGQWEIGLRHGDPLRIADDQVLAKRLIKDVAAAHGMTASFMARPVDGEPGSSCHIHVAVADADGSPALGGSELSAVGRAFAGGLLEHLGDSAVLLAPFVNSYKRHADEFAGGVVAWGEDNRTVAVRLIAHGGACRFEHRYAGADANPYLAKAAILLAGLDGIERGLACGAPTVGDAHADAALERGPLTLGDAVRRFKASAWARAAFGDAVVDHYAVHAEAEWRAFAAHVTGWELERALEIA